MTHKKLIIELVAPGVGLLTAVIACAALALWLPAVPAESTPVRFSMMTLLAVGSWLVGNAAAISFVSTFFREWYEDVPWTRAHWHELVAFKQEVHERLTAMGAPGSKGPDSPCRLGKRLDWVERKLRDRDVYFDTVEAMLIAATGAEDLRNARSIIDQAGPKPSYFIKLLREQALGERDPDEVLALMSDQLLREELFRRFDHAIFAGLVVTKINKNTSHLAATGDYDTRTAHQGNHVTCLGLAAEVVQTIQDYAASHARVRSGYDGKA